MKKYFILTFGCQVNISDSERIASTLQKAGYRKSPSMEKAEVIIINMCSVRQTAVDRVFGLFKKIKSLKARKKIILTGCILKKDQKKLKQLFDFVLPVKSLQLWPEIIEKEQFSPLINQRAASFNKKFAVNYLKIFPQYNQKFSVFIPISTGCNNFCSYCVVPFTRGPLICRPHQEIIKEVKTSLKQKTKQIWLLGQNVNDYRSPTDKKIDFARLLELTVKIKGKFWLSFTSSNPKDFSEKTIEVMASNPKINHYLNLPIQSGDNTILRRMNRPYQVKDYKQIIKKIRKKIPDIFLSTDIIVGFPGETKKQFHNTLKLFKEIKFDMAYIAEYSPRWGTKAYKMKDNVPKKEKVKRREILTKVLMKTALQSNKKCVGKTLEVLVFESQKKDKNLYYIGKTNSYRTVKFQSSASKNLIGKIVKVKITKALDLGLKGRMRE